MLAYQLEVSMVFHPLQQILSQRPLQYSPFKTSCYDTDLDITLSFCGFQIFSSLNFTRKLTVPIISL